MKGSSMTTVYTTQTVSMLANALGVKAGGNDTLVASKNVAGDVSGGHFSQRSNAG